MVQKRIKKFGQELEYLMSENELSVVEVDEMQSGTKKYCWIWIVVDRYEK